MKKFVFYIVVVQLSMLFPLNTYTQMQPVPVVRTQERTIVNGKIYYIHTVQKGQTLYSISKAYEVTQEEIKIANPQVDVVNLVEGLAIRIPESKPKQAALYPENKEDFYAHSVKRRETVYSLARKYRVDDDVIYFYNPWAKEGIKEDQTLWIPKEKELYDIESKTKSGDAFYYYYTVKEKDTLYSISKTYGVTVAEIIDANTILRDGLKPGQVLKIPRLVPGTELLVEADTVSEEIPCITPDISAVFDVALMLPFFASVKEEEFEVPSDTLIEEGTYIPRQRQQGLKGRIFVEFYEGFLLAIDSLKKTGLSVILHVYDTEKDTIKTKRIIRELSSVQPDLLIGPVFPEDVNITGRFARYNQIQLISPLSTRSSLVDRNANVVQVIPSRLSESYAMANYLKRLNKGRIILIRGTDSVSMRNSWIFKKYLLENMPVNEDGNPLYFKDYKLNDSLNNHLNGILSKDEENLVIVFSDSEPEVNILVTRLIQRASLYPVILFGMPSWRNWTNIDLSFFHTLQLHLITPFYADFSNPHVKRFLTQSYTHYGYEPYEISTLGYNYSMLGYDIGFYFLSALRQYGKDFLPCMNQLPVEQLLTRFNFQKTGSGGYINNSFNLIRYRNDFTIEMTGLIKGEPFNHAD